MSVTMEVCMVVVLLEKIINLTELTKCTVCVTNLVMSKRNPVLGIRLAFELIFNL